MRALSTPTYRGSEDRADPNIWLAPCFRITFEQDGDVGVGAGARFGLLASALAGALLLAPVTGTTAVLASLDGSEAAIPTRELIQVVALLSALVSSVTALLSAIGGAMLGALAAALLNCGLGRRKLYAIGEELEVGQAALVTRTREHQLAPLAADLALRGGTQMRPSAAADMPPPARDDPAAARLAARGYEASAPPGHAEVHAAAGRRPGRGRDRRDAQRRPRRDGCWSTEASPSASRRCAR